MAVGGAKRHPELVQQTSWSLTTRRRRMRRPATRRLPTRPGRGVCWAVQAVRCRRFRRSRDAGHTARKGADLRAVVAPLQTARIATALIQLNEAQNKLVAAKRSGDAPTIAAAERGVQVAKHNLAKAIKQEAARLSRPSSFGACVARYLATSRTSFRAARTSFLLISISKEIEDAVRGAVRRQKAARPISALSPDLHRQLITAMKNVISNVAPHSLPPVILAPMDIRRFMRKLIERDSPDLAVLSYQELDPGANVQPLERIKFVTQLSAA